MVHIKEYVCVCLCVRVCVCVCVLFVVVYLTSQSVSHVMFFLSMGKLHLKDSVLDNTNMAADD